MRWEEILADNVTTLDELSASIPQIKEYGDIEGELSYFAKGILYQTGCFKAYQG